MRRPILILVFPILAGIAALSLLARLVVGFVYLADVPALYELIAMVPTFLAHGLARQYLESRELKIKAKVESDGLPEWVGAQAEKNLKKAIPHIWSGCLLQGFVVWSWANGHKGLVSGTRLDGLLALNLAFQVGAFVGEYAMIVAQARLSRDVEGWAKTPVVRLVDSVA